MPSEEWFFNEECALLCEGESYCKLGFGGVNGCPNRCPHFVGKDDEEDD